MINTVVYDAGALIAAQRNDMAFNLMHRRFVDRRIKILVPVPVFVQVYRGDARQHGLHVALQDVELHNADRGIAESAGKALKNSGTSDAVDALVAATAVRLGAPVITSDVDDITVLVEALDAPKHSVRGV